MYDLITRTGSLWPTLTGFACELSPGSFHTQLWPFSAQVLYTIYRGEYAGL